jgi:DeoR/GlpR family transcriptional regulator of sugar metabolism
MTAEPIRAQARSLRERRERIRERVAEHGFVRIEELADEFGVSGMTIHRDLEELEQQGWLRKVRGGATARPSAQFQGDVRYRLQTMTEEKEQLARSAIRLVEPGQAVMLDESTTTLHVARLLPRRGPLTVITHFLAAIKLLAGEPGIDLIALGGAYYPAYDAFFGMPTVEAIRPLRADVLFMSTTAIADGACYHQHADTVQVKRALMEAATRRVLLADHTKLRRHALHQLAPLADFDLVLVDAAIAPAELAELREHGARVEVADDSDQQDEQAVSASRTERLRSVR